ncbi:MAG TPA: type II CAAX endopeptidase family protein [Candidatus Dormibacteraeota bacterium]|jgi:membrane protease YdiL (CAAX protease family)
MSINTILVRMKGFGFAAVASFAVAALGSLTWGPLLVANSRILPSIPWAVATEGAALFVIWRYLGGAGWPRRTSSGRRQLLRGRGVPASQFAWAGIAGALSLIALAGLWIVLVRLTGAGGNPTLSFVSANPLWVAVPVILTASLVSPLSEEAGFRGYGQVLLERRFSPVIAVAGSSLLFALYHGPTQGFAPSKVAFYFIVGVVFGVTALITRSTLPALPVHIAGDLLFFVVIWPHDAGRSLVWTHGADMNFWLNFAQALVFGALAAIAFVKLRAVSRSRVAFPATAPATRARAG